MIPQELLRVMLGCTRNEVRTTAVKGAEIKNVTGKVAKYLKLENNNKT